MMKNNFEPNKYERIEENQDKKRDLQNKPTKNQPKVKIWTISLFDPKPSDKLSYYIVNPERGLDLLLVRDRLAELYGMSVRVYDNLLNMFDVSLEEPVLFNMIEEVTLKVLSEFDA